MMWLFELISVLILILCQVVVLYMVSAMHGGHGGIAYIYGEQVWFESLFFLSGSAGKLLLLAALAVFYAAILAAAEFGAAYGRGSKGAVSLVIYGAGAMFITYAIGSSEWARPELVLTMALSLPLMAASVLLAVCRVKRMEKYEEGDEIHEI